MGAGAESSSLHLLHLFYSYDEETLGMDSTTIWDVHDTFEILIQAPGVGLRGAEAADRQCVNAQYLFKIFQ